MLGNDAALVNVGDGVIGPDEFAEGIGGKERLMAIDEDGPELGELAGGRTEGFEEGGDVNGDVLTMLLPLTTLEGIVTEGLEVCWGGVFVEGDGSVDGG